MAKWEFQPNTDGLPFHHAPRAADVYLWVLQNTCCGVCGTRNMLQDSLELANAAKMKTGVPRSQRKVRGKTRGKPFFMLYSYYSYQYSTESG